MSGTRTLEQQVADAVIALAEAAGEFSQASNELFRGEGDRAKCDIALDRLRDKALKYARKEIALMEFRDRRPPGIVEIIGKAWSRAIRNEMNKSAERDAKRAKEGSDG